MQGSSIYATAIALDKWVEMVGISSATDGLSEASSKLGISHLRCVVMTLPLPLGSASTFRHPFSGAIKRKSEIVRVRIPFLRTENTCLPDWAVFAPWSAQLTHDSAQVQDGEVEHLGFVLWNQRLGQAQ